MREYGLATAIQADEIRLPVKGQGAARGLEHGELVLRFLLDI